MKNTIILILCLLIAACSTTNSGFQKPDLSKISVGMTKSQVIAALGKPDDISTQGSIEYLEYGYDSPYDGRIGRAETYAIRLKNGAVDFYGRKGDFSTVMNPSVDVNVNQKIDSKSTLASDGKNEDIYVQLKKLQQLRDDKVISEEEFQTLKKAAISKTK